MIIDDQDPETIKAFARNQIVTVRSVLNEGNAVFTHDLFPGEARELAGELMKAAAEAETTTRSEMKRGKK